MNTLALYEGRGIIDQLPAGRCKISKLIRENFVLDPSEPHISYCIFYNGVDFNTHRHKPGHSILIMLTFHFAHPKSQLCFIAISKRTLPLSSSHKLCPSAYL